MAENGTVLEATGLIRVPDEPFCARLPSPPTKRPGRLLSGPVCRIALLVLVLAPSAAASVPPSLPALPAEDDGEQLVQLAACIVHLQLRYFSTSGQVGALTSADRKARHASYLMLTIFVVKWLSCMCPCLAR